MAFQRLFLSGRRIAALTAIAVVLSSAAPPVYYIDLATPFERVATATAGQPEKTRIAAVRNAIDTLLPGVYPPGAHTDRAIARALADFPARKPGYDHESAFFLQS